MTKDTLTASDLQQFTGSVPLAQLPACSLGPAGVRVALAVIDSP